MSHPPFPKDDTLGGAVVYSEVAGVACSICAPLIMDQDEVEAAAMLMCRPRAKPWRAIDKSKPPISQGAPTPGPCNHYKDRQHWFLVSLF